MNQQRTLWMLMIGVAVLFVLMGGVMMVILYSLGNDSPQDNTDTISLSGDSMTDSPLPPPSEGKSVIDPPQDVSDFTFVSDEGQPLSLRDLQGRYVVLAFGYTHCPDVCPATLLDFRQVKRALGELASEVAFVFISVDPERDTPDFLHRYIERYDADFIALQGDDVGLNAVKDDLGLFWSVSRDTESGYIVEHTASRFLLNDEGKLIRIYSFTTTPDVIEADIRALLDA